MSIASFVCSIVGLLGTLYSALKIILLNDTPMLLLFGGVNTAYNSVFMLILCMILSFLSIIFGFAGRKKEKKYKKFAVTGIILGFIGSFPIILFMIVTIAVLMRNAFAKSGNQTTVPENDAYIGTRPTYSYFSTLPVIRANTKDTPSYSVIVELVLGYDLNDATAATELTSRLVELQDFIHNYFSNKYNADLQPDKEEILKNDLMEKMNDLLNTAKIRAIYFRQLSTVEM